MNSRPDDDGYEYGFDEDKDGDEMVEIAARVYAETAKAYLLFDGDQKVWVPKSQVRRISPTTFSVPTWIAKEKGLI